MDDISQARIFTCAADSLESGMDYPMQMNFELAGRRAEETSSFFFHSHSYLGSPATQCSLFQHYLFLSNSLFIRFWESGVCVGGGKISTNTVNTFKNRLHSNFKQEGSQMGPAVPC